MDKRKVCLEILRTSCKPPRYLSEVARAIEMLKTVDEWDEEDSDRESMSVKNNDLN